MSFFGGKYHGMHLNVDIAMANGNEWLESCRVNNYNMWFNFTTKNSVLDSHNRSQSKTAIELMTLLTYLKFGARKIIPIVMESKKALWKKMSSILLEFTRKNVPGHTKKCGECVSIYIYDHHTANIITAVK